MRRTMVLVAAVAALGSGCGDGGAFTAHPDVVAKAAGQELSAERVAEILGSAKGPAPTVEAADFIAGLWVDFTLFAQAVAKDGFEADSNFIMDAMWRDVSELRAAHWHDTLVARRTKVDPAKADSIYNAGVTRVHQHILILTQDSSAAYKAKAKKKIEGLLAQAKAGGDFGALAKANSEDPGSAADNGFLPPAEAKAWAPEFSEAGWKLAPGEISGVVTTSYGYHVLRRPAAAEALPRLSAAVQQIETRRVDSTYFAELNAEYGLKVAEDAPAKIRAALENIDGERNSKNKLVTYKGGAFTTKDFLRWTMGAVADPTMGRQLIGQVKAAQDSQLVMFVKSLTESDLLLKDAEKNKIAITAEEWQAIEAGFRSQVDSMRAAMDLTADAIDPKASAGDRSKAAALKVDQFFDRMISGQTTLRVLPGMIAYALRGSEKFGVNQVGVKRAVDLAAAKAGPVPPPQMPGTIQPAPGPAPVPGGSEKP